MGHSAGATNPEVSVLMSCHNASRWLHDASDSVLKQTFGNFEFLLVDDGSTDDTWNIIQTYCARDSRVVAISKKHSGLAHSLNVGVMQAKGAWIARLDADDLWEPTRLEEQMRFVQRHPEVVLLGCDFLQTDEHGRNVRKIHCPSDHSGLLWNLERLQRFFPHSSALFKRDIARDAGCYNAWNRLSEDSDLWLRLAEKGKIACLGNYLVRCRKHPEQISNSKADGISQLVYGIAAAVCHFLRIRDFADPSTGTDERPWDEFVAWIDRRTTEERVPETHRSWTATRAAYLASESRFVGAVRASTLLLRSGRAGPLLREKLFGLSLPRQLAQEWIDRT